MQLRRKVLVLCKDWFDNYESINASLFAVLFLLQGRVQKVTAALRPRPLAELPQHRGDRDCPRRKCRALQMQAMRIHIYLKLEGGKACDAPFVIKMKLINNHHLSLSTQRIYRSTIEQFLSWRKAENMNWPSLDVSIRIFSKTKLDTSRRKQVISALQLGSRKAQVVMVPSTKLTVRSDSERLKILEAFSKTDHQSQKQNTHTTKAANRTVQTTVKTAR